MPSTAIPARGGFATTRWSQVAAAGAGDEARARAALTWLCEAYWQPLRGHAARRLGDAHRADDAVQGFLARLIEKRDLRADPARGRFRSYLLGALDHFLANRRDHAAAQKRGGGRTPVEISSAEPVVEAAPDAAFDRDWALTVLARATDRLAGEHAGGRAALFAALRPFLTANPPPGTYTVLARELTTSEGALKVALHRLRRRWRELARAEVAETLATDDPAEIDAELRELVQALRP